MIHTNVYKHTIMRTCTNMIFSFKQIHACSFTFRNLTSALKYVLCLKSLL